MAPRINLIVAMTADRVIGKDNRMPWDLPEDLKHFRTLTLDKTVIMGRKTWESLGRPLPRRRNMVISRQLSSPPPGAELFSSPEEALDAVKEEKEVFIIGGAEIYRQTLDRAERLYISRVNGSYEGDTWFPPFSETEWELTAQEPREGFTVETWERRKP